jgi:hypothetical protein
MHFDDVLEAADRLSLEEQTTLVEVLHHRVAERRRMEIARDIQRARKEFEAGECKPATPGDLLKDILA